MARAAIVITSGLIVMVATRAAEADVPSHLAHPGNPGRRSCQWCSGHDATLAGLDDDERLATNSLAKQAPNRSAGEDRSGTLLGVSGSALAAKCPAKRVAKGASGILRTRQCRRRNFGVGQ